MINLNAIPEKACHFTAASDVQVTSNGETATTSPVKMIARSGQPIDHWYFGKLIHDMSGMQLPQSRVPIDYCHTDELIGVLNKFDVASGDLLVSGFIKKNPNREVDHAAIIMADSTGDAESAIPYQASINWGGDNIVIEELTATATAEVNGYTVTGPATIVRQWPLRGVAICAYGADQNTSAEIDTAALLSSGKTFKAKEITNMSKQINAPTEAEPKAVEAGETPKTPEPEKTAETVVDPAATELSKGDKKGEAAPAVDPKAAPFILAFGDKGATAFLSGKSFEACATECITELKSAHKTELDAKSQQITELSNRLEAANIAAGKTAPPPARSPEELAADSDPKKAATEQRKTHLSSKLRPGIAAFAAGLNVKAK